MWNRLYILSEMETTVIQLAYSRSVRTGTDQPIIDIIGLIYDKNILTTGHTNECKNEDAEWKWIIRQFANEQNLYIHK